MVAVEVLDESNHMTVQCRYQGLDLSRSGQVIDEPLDGTRAMTKANDQRGN